MTTIDTLLLKIVNYASPGIEEVLSDRDSKVLRSLATSIASHFFITENQSRLLVKILRENSQKFTNFEEEIVETINTQSWSKPFREIEQVKKLQISKNEDGELYLNVECTFNSQIRKIFQDFSKECENLVQVNPGKKYAADLTEKNIVLLVTSLAPHGFDIDPRITQHYETIKNWSKTEVENQFLITSMTNSNFHKHITEDLGMTTAIDQNIINDRSLRYQYRVADPKNHGENLTEVIANRHKSRIWIDKAEHSMVDVIASLVELRRMPLLVVFDTVINNKYYENLEILADALDKNRIFDQVGVYFRLPNDEVGKKFNSMIADKKYNSKLDDALSVAAVSSGKIPKFFLTNTWRPMSVIAMDTKMGLRHGKTSVYSNCCDLIVEWADQPTMFERRLESTWR